MFGKSAILSVRILGDAKGAVDAMGEVESKGGRLGGILKGVGGVVLGAAAVAGGALVGVGVAGVQMAGDLEQSQGAVEAIFKSGSGQMKQFSDQAATTVGLTKNEYNELATTLGAQLKNGGTSIDELGGKTNDLIGIGADLSSQFGGSTTDAVNAISSALKGERDPIEKYGVSLNQASIDAKAAELGFTKVGGSLSAEANQAATMALIMDQTTDAHGNFARESDTYAHKVQVLGAQWGNFVTQVGTMVLPILTTLLGFVVDNVMPGLQSFAELVGPQISAAISQVGPFLTQLVAGFTGAAGGASPLTTALGTVMPALSRIGEAAQGVIPAFINFGQAVIPLVISAVSTLVPIFAQAAEVIYTNVLPLIGQLVPIIQNIATAVIPAVVSAFSVLIPAIAGVIPPIVSIVSTILDVLGPAIEWLLPVVTSIFGGLVQQITGAITIVTGVLDTVAALLRGDWSGAWEGIKTIVSGAIEFVKGAIQQGLSLAARILGTTTDGMLDTITKGFGLIGSNVKTAVSNLVSTVVGFFTNLHQRIVSTVTGIVGGVQTGFNNARSAAVGAFSALVSGVTGFISNLLSRVREIPGQILNALSSLASSLTGVGRNMIQGMINGVGSMAGALTGAVKNLAGKAVNSIKSALGIHSPSRVFAQLGINTGEGFVQGIEKMAGPASSAVEAMVEIPSSVSPSAKITTAGGGGVTINEGDINLTVQGVIDDAMVRKIEAALVRVQQRRGAPAGASLLVGRPA